ncbi:MAG: hypothetical protein ACFFKA_10920 [Candidatus Thorarchaeota archaeon]
MTVFKYEEERHKNLAPYNRWYFQNNVVKPEEQGKGYERLLLNLIII